MDNRPTENRSRVALYDLALALGRVEGMVGQALTYLTDHGRRLDEHDKRITELETESKTRKAYIAGVAAVVATIVWVASYIFEHWDKLA